MPDPSNPFPIEITAGHHGLLGMPAAEFLRDYWQKRPLLIRSAFPDFVSPMTPDDLAGLACEDGTLGRLIQYQREHDRWSVAHGPFAETVFSGLGQRDWTLLVQDVDKWDVDVRALLAQFQFLPRWRLDDIMVSFAAPGGSVGAHVDQYDVFLLQAHGQRRWLIDASESSSGVRPALAFRDDVEIKLLHEFHPTHDWVLEPGDMLYLPPNVPHHGIAETACLTISVGMRAPSVAELLGDYVDTFVADMDDSQRYTDPDLAPPCDPAEIDTAALARVRTALAALRLDDGDALGHWFGRFITTYRCANTPVADPDALPWEEVEPRLRSGQTSLNRHPCSRMAWRRAGGGAATLYACGQDYPLLIHDAQHLASAETINAALLASLSSTGIGTVRALYLDGHYQAV